MLEGYKGTCNGVRYGCVGYFAIAGLALFSISAMEIHETGYLSFLPFVLWIFFLLSIPVVLCFVRNNMPCTFEAGEESVTFKVGWFLRYNIQYRDICGMEVTGTQRAGFTRPTAKKPEKLDIMLGNIPEKNGDSQLWKEEIKFKLVDKELKFTAWNEGQDRREEFDTAAWKLPYQYGRFSELKKFIEEKNSLVIRKHTDEIIDGFSDWLDYSHK